MSGLSLQPSPTADVLIEVLAERARQVAKWGEQNHPDISDDPWDRPIIDARSAKLRTDDRLAEGTVSFTDIAVEEFAEALDEAQAGNTEALRTELVQLAAVCVQWVEAIDRRGGPQAASERALAQLRENLSDDSRLAQDIRDGRLPLRQPGDPMGSAPAMGQP